MLKHTGTIKIETERLVLRKFTFFDIENSYKNWASDSTTLKNVDLIIEPTFQYVEEFICDIIFGYSINKYDYAIELKNTKEIIGSLQLIDIDDYMQKAEIGFLLGSRFWNKGYMNEALVAILDHAIEKINFIRIFGKSTLENTLSEKVMLKSGMIFEGIERKSIKIRDEFFDAKIFSKTK